MDGGRVHWLPLDPALNWPGHYAYLQLKRKNVFQRHCFFLLLSNACDLKLLWGCTLIDFFFFFKLVLARDKKTTRTAMRRRKKCVFIKLIILTDFHIYQLNYSLYCSVLFWLVVFISFPSFATFSLWSAPPASIRSIIKDFELWKKKYISNDWAHISHWNAFVFIFKKLQKLSNEQDRTGSDTAYYKLHQHIVHAECWFVTILCNCIVISTHKNNGMLTKVVICVYRHSLVTKYKLKHNIITRTHQSITKWLN